MKRNEGESKSTDKERTEKRQHSFRLRWLIPGVLLLALIFCIYIIVSDLVKAVKTPAAETLDLASVGTEMYIAVNTVETTEAEAEKTPGIPGSLGEGASDTHVEMLMNGGIAITAIGSYTGRYIEDGTDDKVEDVIMITLENRGDTGIAQAELLINEKYRFVFTDFFPGETMKILEAGRKEYEEGTEIIRAELTRNAVYDSVPGLMEKTLRFKQTDGQLSVKNTGDRKLKDVRIRYKYCADGSLFGGVTWTESLSRLNAGEEILLSPEHFNGDESRIISAVADE